MSKSKEEALGRIADFIAYKIKIKYNDTSLGTMTKNLSDVPQYGSWTALLSAGG